MPAGRLASPVIRGFSRRSNRKLVRNAINFLCLAGGHLEDEKARALEVWHNCFDLDENHLSAGLQRIAFMGNVSRPTGSRTT